MTENTRLRSRSTASGTPVQAAAALVGALFLLVGVLGFIPGITADRGSMAAMGHESHAQLLGLFQVSVLHNLVHVAFGAAGIALARTPSSARAFLVGGWGGLSCCSSTGWSWRRPRRPTSSPSTPRTTGCTSSSVPG